jgi:hypothetical protein
MKWSGFAAIGISTVFKCINNANVRLLETTFKKGSWGYVIPSFDTREQLPVSLVEHQSIGGKLKTELME